MALSWLAFAGLQEGFKVTCRACALRRHYLVVQAATVHGCDILGLLIFWNKGFDGHDIPTSQSGVHFSSPELEERVWEVLGQGLVLGHPTSPKQQDLKQSYKPWFLESSSLGPWNKNVRM